MVLDLEEMILFPADTVWEPEVSKALNSVAIFVMGAVQQVMFQ
jgi:hypothetical protein